MTTCLRARTLPLRSLRAAATTPTRQGRQCYSTIKVCGRAPRTSRHTCNLTDSLVSDTYISSRYKMLSAIPHHRTTSHRAVGDPHTRTTTVSLRRTSRPQKRPARSSSRWGTTPRASGNSPSSGATTTLSSTSLRRDAVPPSFPRTGKSRAYPPPPSLLSARHVNNVRYRTYPNVAQLIMNECSMTLSRCT